MSRYLHIELILDNLNDIVNTDSNLKHDSDAILRHFGRIYGFYGTSEEERMKVDMLASGAEDWRNAYARLVYDPSFVSQSL